jgi:hypothetical protein
MKDNINTSMDQKMEENKQSEPAQRPESRPNERGSFAIMGHVKIFDPNTQETLVETRA